ncbi:MAG: hypothetical protein ABJA67_00620 [Chthonomonadales bacterium]
MNSKMATILPVLCFWLMSTLTRPQSPAPCKLPSERVVKRANLGIINKQTVTAEWLFTPEDSGVAGSFKLKIIAAENKGHKTLGEKAIGESFLNDAKFQAGNFVRKDHKQVFISLILGRVYSAIYDFDGHRLKTLYEQNTGRVWTSMEKVGESWQIREVWPIRQWDDEALLGTGRYVGSNVVERYLRWNGKAFVPVIPGPSKIIRNQTHSNKMPATKP